MPEAYLGAQARLPTLTQAETAAAKAGHVRLCGPDGRLTWGLADGRF